MNNIEFPLISEAMRIYLEQKKLATASLDDVSDRALPGAETNKRISAQKASETLLTLRELVELDSAAIFTVGPETHQAQFAELGEDEGDCIVVPADQFYQELAKLTKPFLDRGAFGITTAQALSTALHRMATWTRVMSYIAPIYAGQLGTVIGDDATLVGLIRGLVRGANGDEFNAAYIAHFVFEKVIEAEYSNNGVTVIVTGSLEEENHGDLAQKLFGGHTVTYDVTKMPDKNDLVLVAKQVKPFFARANSVFQKMNASKARTAKAAKAAEEAAAVAAGNLSDEFKATNEVANNTAEQANHPAA